MDWPEIVTSWPRGLHVAACMSLFGCLVFRRFVLPRQEPATPGEAATARLGLVSACLALAFAAIWLGAVSGRIADAASLTFLLDAMPVVAAHTTFGHLLCLRLILLGGSLLLSERHLIWRMILAGAAIALQPLLGHIGASPDGDRAVLIPVEAAHLLAAGAWLGSLTPLLLCVPRAPFPLATALCERFTAPGLVSMGTIALTALALAGALIGGVTELLGTQYGGLAVTKLGLFCLLLTLAGINRLVLTTRLGTAPGRRWLIRSIAIEAVIGLCVVLTAGALASSASPLHE